MTHYNTGEEQNTIGNLSLSYQKRLPAQSRMHLGFGYTLGVTDRDLDENFLHAEEPLVARLEEQNLLGNPDVVEASIVVQNAEKTTTYVEGPDYIVEAFGIWTEIIIPPGSAISAGDLLSVEYDYLVNPSIEFATETYRGSAALSLFGRRHKIYASVVDSNQDLRSGSDENVRLVQLTQYTLGFETNLERVSYGAEYVDYDSTIDKYRSVEGFWRYLRRRGRTTMSLQFRDIYTTFEETEFTRESDVGGDENAFSVDASYRRLFWRGTMLRTTATYLNVQGRSRDREEYTLGLDVSFRLGQLDVFLVSEIEWDEFDENRYREEFVRLEIRRYF
jgi:hypothetical protein